MSKPPRALTKLNAEVAMRRHAPQEPLVSASTERFNCRIKSQPYDAALGAITEMDYGYASDLLNDLLELHEANYVGRATVVAEWLRKVRYEAVMAERRAVAGNEK